MSLVERVHEIEDRLGVRRVEVAGRFVRQDERRIRDDGARDRHALFLSSGQLIRIVVGAVGQADQGECVFHLLLALRSREGLKEEGEFDVLRRGQHGNQVVGLEDESDVVGAPVREVGVVEIADVRSLHEDFTLRRPIEAADEVEQRRLAGTRRAHEREPLAFSDRKREPGEDLHRFRAARVGHPEIADIHECFSHRISPCAPPHRRRVPQGATR
jgi:hypothetical protein